MAERKMKEMLTAANVALSTMDRNLRRTRISHILKGSAINPKLSYTCWINPCLVDHGYFLSPDHQMGTRYPVRLSRQFDFVRPFVPVPYCPFCRFNTTTVVTASRHVLSFYQCFSFFIFSIIHSNLLSNPDLLPYYQSRWFRTWFVLFYVEPLQVSLPLSHFHKSSSAEHIH